MINTNLNNSRAVSEIKKEKREVYRPKLLGIGLVVLILAFNIFLYGTFTNTPPVIGLAGFNIFALIAVLISYKKERLSPLVFSLAGVSAVAGAFMPLRTNGFVQSVNAAAMFLILIALIFINAHEKISWSILWLIKHVFSFIPKFFDQIVLLLDKPKNKKAFNLMGVFKTVLLTVLVLAFFIGILSQADPVFAEIVKEIKEEALGRTFASLFIAFLTTILLTFKLKAKEDDALTLKFFSYRDIFVPTVAVISLFAVFIVIQVRYLFGGHADIASFDLTYSEYVRKGFLELLTTAFFGSMIAYLVILKKRFLNKGAQLQFKIINVVLIGELLFMLASAFKRDLMYVETYGLTRVRIAGGLFLAWLACSLTLLLIMTLYKRMQEKQLFLGLGAMSVLVLLSLNLLNMDKMVVAGTPEHHDYKDYFYINNLSADAYAAWGESIPELEKSATVLLAKDELSDVDKSQLAGDKLALISLQEKREKLFKKYLSEEELLARCEELNCRSKRQRRFDDKEEKELDDRIKTIRKWQFLSKPEKAAFDEIYANQDLYFNQVDNLLAEIRIYQKGKKLSLEKEERRLLYEFKYPFIRIDLDYIPEITSSIKNELLEEAQNNSDLYNDF
ncbi:MAG: DUF4153 domain-containing protein [Patescibacteria group bacterium]